MGLFKKIIDLFRKQSVISDNDPSTDSAKTGKKLKEFSDSLKLKWKKLITERPRLVIISTAVLILILLGLAYLILMPARPEPKKIKVSVEAPGLTPLRKNAKPDNLSINFAGSAARLEDINKEIKSGITIYPEIEGKWKWIGDDRISFRPYKDWPAGTQFTVHLNENLFPSHVLLRKYRLTFQTIAFSVKITSNTFYIDPRNEDIKQVSATVNFTHPVNPESFEERVSLRPYKLDKDIVAFQDREYKLNIKYDDFLGKAYILSEPLPMPADNVQMELKIEEGVEGLYKGTSSSKELASRVVVPGISNFVRIHSMNLTLVRNDEYRLEQVIVINSKGKARGSDLKKYLDVWILPKDRPEAPGRPFYKDFHWSSPALIDKSILDLSQKVDLEVIDTELEFESLNSFKLKVPPEKYIYIRLKKGAPFYGKYNLSKNYENIIRVQDYPKQLEIMAEGAILSSTGQKRIALMSQGVPGVKFLIGRVQPDQLNHLVSQSNGNLRNLEFRNYRFDEENIVENYKETRPLKIGEPGEINYFSFDFSNYLQPQASGRIRNGIFFFEAREWDPKTGHVSYLYDKRLIIVSDLGVLVKDSKNSEHDIFVQSISSGSPVGNAKIQVLGKNGIPVLTSYTDLSGHVKLPSLGTFSNEKTATVYVISKGDDLSFMPVDAPSHALSYSRFDVGGVRGSSDPNKIDGYLFSERGIYRPGDEFNIGMIVKSGDWERTLAGTPMAVTIDDPRGVEIFRKRFKVSDNGFDELNYNTEPSSPTGIYQINLYTIRKNNSYRYVASTTIKVEEFLPDRLEISSRFPGVADHAWVAPDSLTAQVTLRNLFGSPARGNRIVAQMTISPGRMWFRPYKDYSFSDPLSSRKSFSEYLPEQFTDDEGKAIFDFNLSRFEAATYRLTFSADGFEKESGRNVSTVRSILVSPLSYLIGTKPNGDLSYIFRNSERSINVIAIDSKLKKISVQDIKFELKKIVYVSVLTELNNGTYAYKSVPKRIPVSDTTRIIPESGLKFSLMTGEPGDYELLIKNPDDVQFSRIHYSVIGKGNITRSLDKTAELQIKLNKKDYKPGEEIEIYVKAPYKGAGLITIERDKIYAYKWFKSETNSFLTKITLPSDLTGNGYINVSFVRAADSKLIYMSPLSYGVMPFSISKEDKINKITIDMPGEARSGKVFPIKYKTQKPGTIAVFAVDEGILQVAGYETPAPLDYFFQKRALEVQTSQLLDLILPEFKLYRQSEAMGGGMGFEDISKNLNPFRRKQNKPVVYWSGLLKSDSKERTLEYTVPDYFNGTLRVMAVVVSTGSIGTFEEKAIVKNPYIITPNVPMFAAPSDSFNVSVTVTNGVAGSGKKSPVTLTVESSKHLQVINPERKLTIDEDGDTTLNFYVKANNLPGAAEINFIASGNNETTKLASYLSVRPGIPYQTAVTTGVLRDDDVTVPTPRRMYSDYRILNTSVSYLPVGLSKGLVTYLDKYPHGCTEQVLSQSFPYLFLKDVNGFGVEDSRAAEKVRYALKILQARQNDEGFFGIWAANSYTSNFITVYGMHFITECKKAGYYVPASFANKTLAALKSIANSNFKTYRDWRTQAYAIYVLTLNEVITTNYIAALRGRMDSRDDYWEKDLIAAYLAGSYDIMRQKSEASSLFYNVIINPFDTREPYNFCNNQIQYAQLLYLLSKHSPEQLEEYSEKILSRLAGYLMERSYNTITSSYTIMALTAYAKALGEPRSGEISVFQLLEDKSEKEIKLPSGNFPTAVFSEKATDLEIQNDSDNPVYYQIVQAGFETSLPGKRVSNGIELFREFTNKNGAVVKKVALGDEVKVHIKVRSLQDHSLYNIAIIDLLPAGLEAVPTSLRSNLKGNWSADYTDIREDRIVFYGTFKPNVNEIIYTVRAINKGTFTVPPIYGESMYDNTINGISPQEKLVVE